GALDVVAEEDELVVREVPHARVRVDPGRGEGLVGAGTPDAVDVGECDLHPLLAGDVDAGETCHASAPFQDCGGWSSIGARASDPRCPPREAGSGAAVLVVLLPGLSRGGRAVVLVEPGPGAAARKGGPSTVS